MSKIVWITCKQTVEYKQQCTLSDEEYEEVKDLDLDDIIPNDLGYNVIESHINTNDVFDTDQEFMNVQVITKEQEEERIKKRKLNQNK